MIYRFVGIQESGKKIRDKIEASSFEEAKSKLRAKKIIYETLSQESKTIFENFSFSTKYKIPSKELSLLSRELSMYIRSGISIVAALKIIQTHYSQNKKMKK